MKAYTDKHASVRTRQERSLTDERFGRIIRGVRIHTLWAYEYSTPIEILNSGTHPEGRPRSSAFLHPVKRWFGVLDNWNRPFLDMVDSVHCVTFAPFGVWFVLLKYTLKILGVKRKTNTKMCSLNVIRFICLSSEIVSRTKIIHTLSKNTRSKPSFHP